MKLPTGPQHTQIARIRKELPHISLEVITEIVCGVDGGVAVELTEHSTLGDLQRAWHRAPEGTQEQAYVATMWETAAQRRFTDLLHQQHIIGPTVDLVAYRRSLRDLLYSAPPHSLIRRLIVREIVLAMEEEGHGDK